MIDFTAIASSFGVNIEFIAHQILFALIIYSFFEFLLNRDNKQKNNNKYLLFGLTLYLINTLFSFFNLHTSSFDVVYDVLSFVLLILSIIFIRKGLFFDTKDRAIWFFVLFCLTSVLCYFSDVFSFYFPNKIILGLNRIFMVLSAIFIYFGIYKNIYMFKKDEKYNI